jgi:hypothetical protein
MMTVKPLLQLELRPVAAPKCATSGARVFMLLPELDVLVGRPGFGRIAPIEVPGTSTSDAWAAPATSMH